MINTDAIVQQRGPEPQPIFLTFVSVTIPNQIYHGYALTKERIRQLSSVTENPDGTFTINDGGNFPVKGSRSKILKEGDYYVSIPCNGGTLWDKEDFEAGTRLVS